MTALQALIDRSLQDPLAAARAAPGAIGYIGTDIPYDLLRASGRTVCHLPWDADRATPTADQWLESSFPGWARSMLEDWSMGRFDCFERVVFSRGDDGAHRLYYYVCELQRRGLIGGPRPLVFDIACIPRASSVRHCARSIQAFAEALNIDDAALCAGIADGNALRARFAAIEADRRALGSAYERLARASLYADFTAAPDAELPAAGSVRGRVLLAGSAPPDDRIHLAIEQAGWNVTGEAHHRALTRLGPTIVDYRDDPVAALAAWMNQHAPSVRGFIDRDAWLISAARRARADVVIIWLDEQEEAQVWQVPAQRAALARAGIPALVLTRRRWDAADGTAAAITDFFAGLAS